jgi:hypothetical protein
MRLATVVLSLTLCACATQAVGPARAPAAEPTRTHLTLPFDLEGPEPESEARRCSHETRLFGPISATLRSPGHPVLACRLGRSPVEEVRRAVRASTRMHRCLEHADASGVLRATVQIEPTGRVSRVTIHEPDPLSLEVARCARWLTRIEIRPPGCRLAHELDVALLSR